MANDNNHGGARPGAGRPQTTTLTHPVNVRISPEAADHLAQQPHKGEYINALILADKETLSPTLSQTPPDLPVIRGGK